MHMKLTRRYVTTALLSALLSAFSFVNYKDIHISVLPRISNYRHNGIPRKRGLIYFCTVDFAVYSTNNWYKKNRYGLLFLENCYYICSLT